MARRAVGARPRVAHFTVAPEFVDRIMVHDLRRLRDHEDVTVISTDGPPLDRARAEGFRVLTIEAQRKIRPWADLRALWILWRLFRRERFDLLHSYTPKAGLLGQMAGLLAGIPRRIHGCRGLLYGPAVPRWQQLIFRMTDWLTNRIAHATLYLSSADMRFSIEHGLCRAAKAHLIGSGIDLEQFAPSPKIAVEAAAWRRQVGVEPDKRLVLSVGRYVAAKGYADIARAAALLRARHPEARYVWIAPVFAGEDEVLSLDLPSEMGVGDIVQCLGYVENMAPLLAAADVLVHASHREGVPRALMEAAAMGTPIVASDIPGCREVVRHEESALLFAAHDAQALADALGRALDDWPATSARAARARAVVLSEFEQGALSRRVWARHAALLEEGPGATAPMA
ncbi:MAG: glycosyl transferase group 1 [Gemmatimonadetes bacterium]|nr:glycosyl transferase group 1 [Gemmatimonadota bacterium]